MSVGIALPLLVLSLTLTLAAARTFARRLDRLGVSFGLPEAVIGLLTALAADGPEISSALIALVKGQHGVSVGVLVGSNAFNLAAMVGVSALLAGAVTVRRGALVLEGAMGLLATLLAAAVLLGDVVPWVAMIVLVGASAAYLFALMRGSAVRLRSPSSGNARKGTAEDDHGQSTHRKQEVADARAHHALWIVSDVALILAGSFGMVEAAVALGGHWDISGALIGVLLLGPLTSIPNAATGVRLGLGRRGSALVSETLNSNTINLGAGVIAPALFTSVVVSTDTGRIGLAWLLVMTVLCLACLAREGGARRGTGIALVLMYVGFVAVQLGA